MKRSMMSIAASAMVLLLSACAPKVKVSEWEIPFLDCLTGPIASIGEYLNWGAQQAAREINNAGGIAGKPVKVVAIDTGLEPQTGVVQMARVVEKSLAALGPVPEAVIHAAMPLAVDARMMCFTATASLEDIQEFFPWAIGWFPPTSVLSKLTAAWVAQFSDVKSVTQMVEPYGTWPAMASAHAQGIRDMNVAMNEEIQIPTDAISFAPLVVKALAQKPDAVILTANPDKIAAIIKELVAHGWSKMDHILIFGSGDAPALYAAGGSAIDGCQIYSYIDPNLDTPRWNTFKEAYQKDHNGELPPSLSPNYYDALYMIKEAIEKTGVTGDPAKLAEERKKISDYCANVKGFKGIMFNWDETNDVPTNKPAFIFKIEGDKKILVKEVKL